MTKGIVDRAPDPPLGKTGKHHGLWPPDRKWIGQRRGQRPAKEQKTGPTGGL